MSVFSAVKQPLATDHMFIREGILLGKFGLSLSSFKGDVPRLGVRILGDCDEEVRSCVMRLLKRDSRLSSVTSVFDCWDGKYPLRNRVDEAFVVYLPRIDSGNYSWCMGEMLCNSTKISLSPYRMPVNDNYGFIPLLVHESNICASAFLMFYKNKMASSGPVTSVCGCSNKMCGFNPLWNSYEIDNVTMHAAYNAICEERGVLNYDKCDSVLGRKFNVYNVLLRAVLYSSDTMLFSRMVHCLDNSMKTACNYPVPDGCLVLDGCFYDRIVDEIASKNKETSDCMVKIESILVEKDFKVKTAVEVCSILQQKDIVKPEFKLDNKAQETEVLSCVSVSEYAKGEKLVEYKLARSESEKCRDCGKSESKCICLLSRVDISDSVKGEKLVKEEIDRIAQDRCTVCKVIIGKCVCPDPLGTCVIKDERSDREGIFLPIVKLVDCVSKYMPTGRSWEVSYDFCGMNGTSSVALEAYTGSSSFVNLQIDISIEGRDVGEIKRNLLYGQSIRSVISNMFVNADKIQSLRIPSCYVPHDRVHYNAAGIGKDVMSRSMFVRTTNSVMVQYFKCAIGSITADHFRRLANYSSFKAFITPHYWQDKPKFVQMLLGMGYKLPNFVSRNNTVATIGTVRVPVRFKKKKCLI